MCDISFYIFINKVKLFSLGKDKAKAVNMLLSLLLLFSWISNGDQGNY